eukprot:SM007073S21504  [mRNA]  locus=s7073:26:710:- [translate_table: standard]
MARGSARCAWRRWTSRTAASSPAAVATRSACGVGTSSWSWRPRTARRAAAPPAAHHMTATRLWPPLRPFKSPATRTRQRSSCARRRLGCGSSRRRRSSSV